MDQREMKTSEVTDNQRADESIRVQQGLEDWKHFAATGAADKNTMVSVTSWLLSFSATIIWYIVTQMFTSNFLGFVQPWLGFCLAILGLGTSFTAFYVALLYGGYANRNWAKADEAARNSHRCDLIPDYPGCRGQQPVNKAFGLPRFAVGWSEDCDPENRLPPVFWLFAGLAAFVFAVHFFFWLVSVWQLLGRYFSKL